MAFVTTLVLTEDEGFRKQAAGLLRSGSVPLTVSDERSFSGSVPCDLVVVDGRERKDDGIALVERVRAAAPGVSIFFVALEMTPDVILQAMRAGANEFFAWPPAEGPFNEGLSRAAARRNSTSSARHRATTLSFFGAKGGAGTTTIAVNTAVELARLSKRPTVIVDVKAGLGEVTLFLGVRSRYTLLDAIDNLHRLDGEFLKELVIKHKSGLDVLAGSDHFDRPGGADSGAIEEVLRLLAQRYKYIVIDAGAQLNACSTAALYTSDSIYLIPNPDVPSIRNAQRLLDRIGQLGACGERVRILLNRASEPYPIPPDQIESALGREIHHSFRSDYRVVSAALNSGVPLSLSGSSDLATQFDNFTQLVLGVSVAAEEPGRRGALGLQRLASIW